MKFTAVLAALAGLAAAAPKGTSNQLHQRTPEERIRLGSRTHHSTMRSSPGHHGANVRYSSNWAGVVKHSKGITRVSGTSAVPRVQSGPSNSGGSTWVGIDGDSCQRALLQTGIDFYVDGTYDAWWEWIPDGTMYFDQPFPLSVGDQISMEVDASSTKTGVATLINLSTGDKVTHTFTKDKTPSALCETDAEWIMEDFLGNLADFGGITFTNNSATGATGTFTPAGGDILDLRTDSGDIKTDCGLKGSDVYCNYVN